MEIIDSKGFEQKWIQDNNGFFLIRVNRNSNIIEVGHCNKNKEVLRMICGNNPEEIMYKIIDLNLISSLDHAAYLGKELQKAYLALNEDYVYIQDSELKKYNFPLIIEHRVNKIADLLNTPKNHGVEIDIRGFGKKLLLNHDPIDFPENYDELENYLKEFNHAFIIFNIKETGIEQQVIELAQKYNISNYFLLDVEFPYLYKATRKLGIRKIAVRYSEAEPIEAALAQKGFVDWVWIDTNTKLPLDKGSYDKLKEAGFRLCLVCPERWGRPQDIKIYKNFLIQNNIKIDAIMTEKHYVSEWTSIPTL